MKDEQVLKTWLVAHGAKIAIHHGHYYGLTCCVTYKGHFMATEKTVGGKGFDRPLLDWAPCPGVIRRRELVAEFMKAFGGKKFRDYDGRYMFVLPSSIPEMALQLAAEGRMP